MPFYVVLGSWTEEGVRTIKQSPQRGEEVRKVVERAGGRVHMLLYTLGAHDFVTFIELPSDEAANQFLLHSAMQGFARTVTLKGWTPAEFAQLVQKI
jgi:uncharacterized protein with GYD domain